MTGTGPVLPTSRRSARPNMTGPPRNRTSRPPNAHHSLCREWQSSCLSEALPGWLKEIPLYRPADNTTAHEPLGTEFPAAIAHLPFITKQEIRRDFPRNFLRAGADLNTLLAEELVELEHTSGTSEERTRLLLPYGWWRSQENRTLRLNSVVADVLNAFPVTRRVTITPPVCGGDICYAGRPDRADRIVDHALFVNLSKYPFLWNPQDLARMAEEAVSWSPTFLDVDPVYGVGFALHCESQGIRLPSLRFIICSYEFLSVVHRRILQRVFGVPVFDLYGSTETGHLLMEDEHGRMAPSCQTALLEVPDPDHDGIGELIVTTLSNDYMPLIRYRIGDLVEHRHSAGADDSFVVHGRARDALLAVDGRRVTTRQVDRCFEETTGIAHYELRQTPARRWRLRYLPDPGTTIPPKLSDLRTRLEGLLGKDTCGSIEATDLLMPEGSGKFQLTGRVL
jgi:phenylacetate-CoA ligase